MLQRARKVCENLNIQVGRSVVESVDLPKLYEKYIPPLLYSLMHSLTILRSSSDSFSSTEAGGGAVAASMLSTTVVGSSSSASRILFTTSCSSKRESGSGIGSCLSLV